ncbi:MAG: hypothetical protein KDA61_09510 [Planctomycetales bacterium]|nr:hypothetical protein [Planctomycetales bacterium]
MSSLSLAHVAPCLLAVGLVTLGGCGSNEYGVVPVAGTVTFDGQPPPTAGRVTFTPNESFGGLPRRPGVGRFREDGAFSVTSFKEGDGLIPGRYQVTVSCMAGMPDISQRDASASVTYVAEGFEPEPLVVELGSDPIAFNLDVPLNQEVAKKFQRQQGADARAKSTREN